MYPVRVSPPMMCAGNFAGCLPVGAVAGRAPGVSCRVTRAAVDDVLRAAAYQRPPPGLERRIARVKLFNGALRFRLSTIEKLIAESEQPALRESGLDN